MAFFTAAGRLRRRYYFLRVMGLYTLGAVIYAIPGLLNVDKLPVLLTLSALIGILLIGYLVVVQCVLRLHDLDLQSWWALILLLPIVSYILGGGMQLVQGTIGPNRFGPDTKRPDLVPPIVPNALSAADTELNEL